MAEVVNDWPPNIAAIRKVLPVSKRNIFAYDGKIYSPGAKVLAPELHAHEAVHFRQQANYPGGPDAWWDEFLRNKAFRLEQELPAHQAEYRHIMENAPNRGFRRKALKQLAKRLSAPMYGNIISTKRAMELIDER